MRDSYGSVRLACDRENGVERIQQVLQGTVPFRRLRLRLLGIETAQHVEDA